MRKLFTLTFLLFLLTTYVNISFGQPLDRPAVKWQKCLGGSKDDGANDVLLNSDGTMVMVGYSKSNDGDLTLHYGSTDSADAWVVKLNASGNVLWQKSFGGSNEDRFKSIISTNDGGYLCIGSTNSSDLDIISNHGETDFFVVKLDSAGSLVWKHTYGGSKADTANSAVATADGGFAIIGTTFSSDGDVQSGIAGRAVSNAWVIKINSNGLLVWEKCLQYGTYNNNTGANIFEDQDHNLVAYTSGSDFYNYLHNNIDTNIYKTPGIVYLLDKGTGASTFKLHTGGDADFAMCKAGGKYYFSYQEFYTEPAYGLNCITLQSKVGNTDSAITTVSNLQMPYNLPCFWAPGITSKYYFSGVNGISRLTDSSVLSVGKLNYVSNHPYGYEKRQPAILYFPTTNLTFEYGGNENTYSYGYHGAGVYTGVPGSAGFNSVKSFPGANEYLVAGNVTGGTEATGLHGLDDCWILCLTKKDKNRIAGNVFLDINKNGIKDSGEPPFSSGTISAQKYQWSSSTSINDSGYYEIPVDSGKYELRIQSSDPYYGSFNPTDSSFFATPYNQKDTVDFPVILLPPGTMSASIYLQSAPEAVVGKSFVHYIFYMNHATDSMINKKIVFIKDHRTTFESNLNTPVPYSISGDTIIWNISRLLPGGRETIGFTLKMDSLPSLKGGDTISSSAYIDSTGDLEPGDNISVLRKRVSPQPGVIYCQADKKEIHGGIITPAQLSADTNLTYTIYFQNIGDGAISNLVIKDTLHPKLTGNSLQTISSSHSYNIAVDNNNIATWTFSNINLPDNFTGDSLSKGYITFKVSPSADFLTGDSIKNTAAIYFDSTNSVSTNSTLTIFAAARVIWTGAVSTEWGNPLNWDKGIVPDKWTDVYINGGTAHNPTIDSTANGRVIYVNPSASVTVIDGATLQLTGAYLRR